MWYLNRSYFKCFCLPIAETSFCAGELSCGKWFFSFASQLWYESFSYLDNQDNVRCISQLLFSPFQSHLFNDFHFHSKRTLNMIFPQMQMTSFFFARPPASTYCIASIPVLFQPQYSRKSAYKSHWNDFKIIQTLLYN